MSKAVAKAKTQANIKTPAGPKGGLAQAALRMAAAGREEEQRARDRNPRPAAKPKPRTRQGKKGLVLYVEPEMTVAIRQLALANGTDVQALGRRALELLFADYRTPLPGTLPT